MPELPEAECVRRVLGPALVGRPIARLEVHRADFVEQCGAEPIDFRGARCTDVSRRGKRIGLFTSAGPAIEIRLGMSGQPRLLRRGQTGPADHVHAAIHLGGRRSAAEPDRLILRDIRRFGGVRLLPSRAALEADWRASMGPDALAVGPKLLAALLAGARRPLKAALLDQGLIAGLGNIYVDEACHRAGLSPLRPASTLTPTDAATLRCAIHEVLRQAVEKGGSTLRDYRDPLDLPGDYASTHTVYGRPGLPCFHCGGPLRATRVLARATIWCPACQT